MLRRLREFDPSVEMPISFAAVFNEQEDKQRAGEQLAAAMEQQVAAAQGVGGVGLEGASGSDGQQGLGPDGFPWRQSAAHDAADFGQEVARVAKRAKIRRETAQTLVERPVEFADMSARSLVVVWGEAQASHRSKDSADTGHSNRCRMVSGHYHNVGMLDGAPPPSMRMPTRRVPSMRTGCSCGATT